jgi:hypothetical protein
MTKPKTPKSKEPAKPRKAHVADAGKDATPEEKRSSMQKLLIAPETRAVLAMQTTSLGAELLDVPGLVDELKVQIEAVRNGDLSHAEGMLLCQAIVLEDLFVTLTSRAMGQTQLSTMEPLLRMALRAQNQSRQTLETLAAVKNPPIIYAKQANISAGHQQINNAPAHAGKIENKPNELLEATNHERLDTRAASQASCNDSSMEAVGTLDRR